ncbi:LPXTG cell wall anchor domain-containing protein [Enterococcus ureilyticus]|uniref:LPXTG cell wall anchor domain-containing protein n=1 Tax=Enterococcus ureilyticus TaxID=1131292 RepID=UPI001A923362|nr:LPXTG cell wall anchor domain-containing protein [Enterococcus ureilyticus]
MKKYIHLLTVGVLLASSIPMTTNGEEVHVEDNNTISDISSETNGIEVELIEQETTDTELLDSESENAQTEIVDQENEQEDAKVEETKTSGTEQETVNEAAAVTNEVKATPQAYAISPELGIPIPDYDGKLVDKENTITDIENSKVTSDYAFMPQITDKTQVVVEGNHVTADGKYIFYLKENSKGKVTVTYKNVGTYDGEVIDLKISFDDWTFMQVFNNAGWNPRLTIGPQSTGIFMYGLSDLKANYYFLDHLTGLQAQVSGFFNFTDIDNNQYLDIYNNANIKNFYASKDNVLYYKNNDGYISVGDYIGQDADDELKDNKYWLTYTYNKTSNFTITFHELREAIRGYGALFEYTYEAPVVIEPQAETKTKKLTANNTSRKPVYQSLNTAKVEQKNAGETVTNPLSANRLPETGEQNSSHLFTFGLLLISSLLFFKRKDRL